MKNEIKITIRNPKEIIKQLILHLRSDMPGNITFRALSDVCAKMNEVIDHIDYLQREVKLIRKDIDDIYRRIGVEK